MNDGFGCLMNQPISNYRNILPSGILLDKEEKFQVEIL